MQSYTEEKEPPDTRPRSLEISIEGLQNADFEKYADSQLEAMASMAKVPKEKVRIISKDEYEENTEEE